MKYGKDHRIKWTVFFIVILICLYVYVHHYNIKRKDNNMQLNIIDEIENKTEKLISPNITKTKMIPNLPVYFWIDIPNDFPWRNCFQEYNKALTPLHCNEVFISTYI